MAFDSAAALPALLSAVGLFAASVGAWSASARLRAGARLYLRFAATLFAALSVAFPVGFSGAASLLLLPLAASALVIAALALFAAPLPVFPASLVLILGLACGLGASVSGISLLAFIPPTLAGLVILAASLNRGDVIAALAGAALALSALVFWNESAQSGMFLFCAAALLGLARPSLAGNRARDQLLRSSNNALRGEPRLP